MAANESLHPIQFQYHPPEMGANYHSVTANLEHTEIGTVRRAHMSWDAKKVRGIDVPHQFQRQGIATALWQEGHRLASENQAIPEPRHSPDRTAAGDAWAKSVGGRLPRRKP
jgi:hypothetical protein